MFSICMPSNIWVMEQLEELGWWQLNRTSLLVFSNSLGMKKLEIYLSQLNMTCGTEFILNLAQWWRQRCGQDQWPHFTDISPQERSRSFLPVIRFVLVNKFQNQNLVHPDVRWRNVGFYVENNKPVPVVYDLTGVEEYNEVKHRGWIDFAIANLTLSCPDYTDPWIDRLWWDIDKIDVCKGIIRNGFYNEWYWLFELHLKKYAEK